MLFSLGCSEVVVKAQILAGGRGKGEFTSGLKGGVKVTKRYTGLAVTQAVFWLTLPGVIRLDTVADLVSQMIGYNLITKQTPPEGVTVNKVSTGCRKNVYYWYNLHLYTKT